jgi:nitrogen fixation/metabolism regulation signal transduction histidine kinase
LALLVIPGLTISGVLLWLQSWPVSLKLIVFGAELLAVTLTGAALRDRLLRPVRTLANVVSALREQDYSFRAQVANPHGALGELSLEINLLADQLAQQRTGAFEAAALLQRVVDEVDIPIFAFDPADKLRLLNPAGERLLQGSYENVLGASSTDLGLKGALVCDNETLIGFHFNSGTRWLVRRSTFRQQGVPHTLVVLSDVSRALREEERLAWQRLIRVLGHELNNSLAPIKSIAGSLNARLATMEIDDDCRRDFERGLGIIETRAASLNRFLQAYRDLAQIPPPVLQRCSLSTLVARAAALESRVQVSVLPGPEVALMADPDQLEQMFINLLRNAAEAMLEPSALAEDSTAPSRSTLESAAGVVVAWKVEERNAILTIEDSGHGLMNPGNVFVPFYTTKPRGSGIGLLLCRQISEAHSGTLELMNRKTSRGCVVRVTLPRAEDGR